MSKQCPSLSKHIIFVSKPAKDACKSIIKMQHSGVQAFRPTGLFIILKGLPTRAPAQQARCSSRILSTAPPWGYPLHFPGAWPWGRRDCRCANSEENPPLTVSEGGECILNLETYLNVFGACGCGGLSSVVATLRPPPCNEIAVQ